MKCKGCGSMLQISQPTQTGYVADLQKSYCLRCFKLANYGQIISQEIDAASFAKQLGDLIKNNKEKRHFYYVIDLFDLEHSRDLKLEALLKNELVTILVNKIDLLPKAVKPNKIVNYLKTLFARSNLTNYQILLISAQRPQMIERLHNGLMKKSKLGNKQYFIGHSNVGKSSLINALLKYNNQPAEILTATNFHTTLNLLPVKLNDDLMIIDTPGTDQPISWNGLLPPDERKFLYFKKELKQYTYHLHSHQSLVIGGILSVSFDFHGDETIGVHCYGYQNVDLHRTNANQAAIYLEKHQQTLHPHAQKVNEQMINCLMPKLQGFKEDRVDLSLGNLGWINLPNLASLKVNLQTNVVDDCSKLKQLVSWRQPLI